MNLESSIKRTKAPQTNALLGSGVFTAEVCLWTA